MRYWSEILKALTSVDLDKLLKQFVEELASRYGEVAVVLFGSRARGSALPYSDYDVAVILRSTDSKIELVEEMYKLKPPELPADIVVLELDELDDPIVEKMLSECVVLHDSLGISSRLPCTAKQPDLLPALKGEAFGCNPTTGYLHILIGLRSVRRH